MKRKTFLILSVLIILFISGPVSAWHDKYEVHFLDTGQSDCILIKGGNKNYLIDTGAEYYSDKIISYLDSSNINVIDMLILTHYHDDHYGGMLKIIDNKNVKMVLLPKHYNEIKSSLKKDLDKRNIRIKYIDKGFKIKKNKIDLEIIAPFKEDKKIENNNSLVIQGKIDGIKYLFAADCEKEEENDMVKSGELKQCDILKLPHHSLDTSSTDEFIQIIQPKIAIVTCNGVDTPDLTILKRLYEKGIVVLRTDIKGDIVIKDGFVGSKGDNTNIRINVQ